MSVYFGNDLYHRDDRMVSEVAAGAPPGARVVQAFQALRRIAVS
jgi:hypothetical protein